MSKMTIIKMHPELQEAWEKIKPYCVEVEYIESGSYQGGEEESFLKGAKRGGTAFVFSPDFEPYQREDE